MRIYIWFFLNKYALSVKEGLAILKLFETIVVGVFADVVAQLLPLLFQVVVHFFVHLFKHHVYFR